MLETDPKWENSEPHAILASRFGLDIGRLRKGSLRSNREQYRSRDQARNQRMGNSLPNRIILS